MTDDPRTEAQAAIQYWSQRLNEIEGEQAQAAPEVPESPGSQYAPPATQQYPPPRELMTRVFDEAIAAGKTETQAQGLALAAAAKALGDGDTRHQVTDAMTDSAFVMPTVENAR